MWGTAPWGTVYWGGIPQVLTLVVTPLNARGGAGGTGGSASERPDCIQQWNIGIRGAYGWI